MLYNCLYFYECTRQSYEKQDSPIDIDLWQNGLPNTNGMEAQGYDDKKNNFKPSIRVYLPKASQQPARAVIICPGGGYGHLAMAHEGYDWAPFSMNRE